MELESEPLKRGTERERWTSDLMRWTWRLRRPTSGLADAGSDRWNCGNACPGWTPGLTMSGSEAEPLSMFLDGSVHSRGR